MANSSNHPPTLEEVQKEIDELKRKYGNNIKVKLFSPSSLNQIEAEEETEEKPLDLDFNYRPKDIKAFLDRYVIKQDDAKKALAIAICDHYNHVMDRERNPASQDEEYTKQNIILIGPTGVGKTYLIRTIARMIGVPFVKADATKFSETGYVGGNVEDLVRDLVTQANGDLKAASYGIIYLDEVDKIASAPGFHGRDVSGRGVQMGLLKLMEETDVDVRAPNDLQAQFQAFMEAQQKGKAKRQIINTRHIQFIVSGAFNGLKEIIKKRLHKSQVGFSAEIQSKDEETDYFPHVTSQDFIEFGFEPEFIGRLPVHVACQSLSAEDLFDVLRYSEGSIIRQYTQDFKAYGIDVIFSNEGLKKIAEIAHSERTGARGLMTVCERTLREFKFELSSSDVRSFVVTSEIVANPRAELAALLNDPNPHRRLYCRHLLKRYEKDFLARREIAIRFEDAAADYIADLSMEAGVGPEQYCDDLFGRCEHGLNLIKKNNDQAELVVTLETIRKPDEAIEGWIRESYANQTPDSEPA